jgi:hypothetical protein
MSFPLYSYNAYLENPHNACIVTALRDPAYSQMALALQDLTSLIQKDPYSVFPLYRNGYELLFLNTDHLNFLLVFVPVRPFWPI